MSIGIPENEFDAALRSFGTSTFNTQEFARRLEELYPETWARIEREYGSGGRGARTHYSAYSRVSQVLHHWSVNGRVTKNGYVAAPADYGSPVIRTWNGPYERTENLYPDEVEKDKAHIEGAVLSVLVNKYERDPSARAECIAHYGYTCQVCDFDFGQKYGELGAEFIHVHHRTPLSKVGGEYEVDPVRDLVPVCPNCHAMLHRTGIGLTVDELKECIRNAAGSETGTAG